MTKVLFVEDDSDQAFLYREVLNLKGIETDSAISGEEALKKVAENKPDLIFMDILLNGENGLDVMQKIKQDEKTKDIPVIVFTNTNKKEYKDRAEDLGAADFLIKSQIVPQEVAEKVKAMFEKKS